MERLSVRSNDNTFGCIEWPLFFFKKQPRPITLLDPCMGSGHFLVFALPMLAALRATEKGLEPDWSAMGPVELVDQIEGRRSSRFGVESHVERPIGGEAKAAVEPGKLIR